MNGNQYENGTTKLDTIFIFNRIHNKPMFYKVMTKSLFVLEFLNEYNF